VIFDSVNFLNSAIECHTLLASRKVTVALLLLSILFFFLAPGLVSSERSEQPRHGVFPTRRFLPALDDPAGCGCRSRMSRSPYQLGNPRKATPCSWQRWGARSRHPEPPIFVYMIDDSRAEPFESTTMMRWSRECCPAPVLQCMQRRDDRLRELKMSC